MKYSLYFLIVSFFLLIACKSDEAKPTGKKVIETVKTELVAPSSQVVDADTLRYCLAEGDLGVGGYDLVNYFVDNSAKLGSPEFKSIYDGVNYQFINKKNKDTFDSNPKDYLPSFGGWCSMTLAMGNTTMPKYDNFKIINGKLYLFERTLSINGQTLWLQDTLSNKKLAHKNYIQYIENGSIEIE